MADRLFNEMDCQLKLMRFGIMPFVLLLIWPIWLVTTGFVNEWKGMIKKVGDAFVNTFWKEGHDHLADVVKDGIADWSVRPNMVIAVAMDYSPFTKEQQKSVLSVAKRQIADKTWIANTFSRSYSL